MIDRVSGRNEGDLDQGDDALYQKLWLCNNISGTYGYPHVGDAPIPDSEALHVLAHLDNRSNGFVSGDKLRKAVQLGMRCEEGGQHAGNLEMNSP